MNDQLLAVSIQHSAVRGRGDAIVIEDYVDRQCIWHIHLMSNARLPDLHPLYGLGNSMQEIGVWHWRTEIPYRGVMDFHCEGWKKFRRLVVWSLEGHGSVREAISQSYTYFFVLFNFRPGFIFINKLPKGAENCQLVEGMFLTETEWMPGRCVAVGGKR